jgi:hypothetical protein
MLCKNHETAAPAQAPTRFLVRKPPDTVGPPLPPPVTPTRSAEFELSVGLGAVAGAIAFRQAATAAAGRSQCTIRCFSVCRPSSVIRRRANSSGDPRTILTSRSAIASCSLTKSSNSHVNRETNASSARPRLPASASIPSHMIFSGVDHIGIFSGIGCRGARGTMSALIVCTVQPYPPQTVLNLS